ncbi:MAG: hypothetical protein GSR85_02435 [Desulfurococcales archaeon]|nr:hypothetical protein [Desulfurococcales archaeon]
MGRLKYIVECMRKAANRADTWIVCGLDPGASPGNTGYAVLKRINSCTWVLQGYGRGSVDEVLQLISGCPIVGVDSPIHPPYRGFRRVERKAMGYGAKLLPGGIKGMRDLARIGYSIALLLCHRASIPVETHPGSIRLLHSLDRGFSGFKDYHVEDAILSAIAAASAVCGLCSWFVDRDGVLCFPRGKPSISYEDGVLVIRID